MTRPFLIVQLRPEDDVADSELHAILRYGRLRGDEFVRLQLDRHPFPRIDLDDHSAIIVGGSPFEISTPAEAKTDLQERIEEGFEALLETIIERDYPFLGACSGNGLLGSFLGARMSTRYAEPVGAAWITMTSEGMVDPLLEGLPARFRALLGHKEACDELPPTAVLLAGSEACPIQMFRVKTNVYATQFHPEADPAGFALRIRVYRNHGYFPPEEAEGVIASVREEETPVPQAMLRRFVERYRS